MADSRIYEIVRGLDPSSRTPLYEQLAHVIDQAILKKELLPGTALPPEQEFAARLGLSRQTVNQH